MSPASPATETIDDALDSSETNFSVVPADYANWSQARHNAYMTAAAKAYADEQQRANTPQPNRAPRAISRDARAPIPDGRPPEFVPAYQKEPQNLRRRATAKRQVSTALIDAGALACPTRAWR